MKSSKIIWIPLVLLVSVMLVISIGTVASSTQQNTNFASSNTILQQEDAVVADYNAPEPTDPKERDKKFKKNRRYDKKKFVLKRPPNDPETTGVSITHEEPAPPPIPYAQSALVIVGEIRFAKSSLSNDKEGIYTEFCIAIQSILKSDNSKTLQIGDFITADRAGGTVRYPNGRRLIYELAEENLPKKNQRYVLFMYNDDPQNPNYKIITGYELKNGIVGYLDRYPESDSFNGMNEASFINLILSSK